MHDSDAETQMPGTGPDPLSSLSQKRRRGVKVTAAAVVALGLALGGGAVAGAASTPSSTSSSSSGSSTHPGGPPPGGSPPAVVGTVESVGTDTFTVTTRDGTTVTTNVGSTTIYRDPGVTSPTIADVTVGEHVAVFGTDTSDTVAATSVLIGNPPSGGPGGPGGPGGHGGHGGPDGPRAGGSASHRGTGDDAPAGPSGHGGPPTGTSGW